MKIEDNNPYVGLRPFEVDESLLFFGRNDQTLELLQRLHAHHFVAVVGSSGCGKSSLLRAGLIPALIGGYLVDDSDHWLIAIMKPGQNPLYHLAEAVLKQVNKKAEASDVLDLVQKIKEAGADVLIDLLKPLHDEKNINFFLLVDQFEELFRFAMEQNEQSKKDEAIDFVNIMLELAQQSHLPIYVVITMRSDFIGDCSQFYGLPEAMNKSQYLVPKLNRIQLKTVIEGPAKLYGGKLNPALTSRLLNELGKVKDELPLLQHALMRMWDYEMKTEQNGEIDLQDYENIGGIEKALSNHADEALKNMSDGDMSLTKTLFQALTEIDENGRKIRRPVKMSQLKILSGASEEKLLSIINCFIKDRRSFLIISNSGASSEKIIDISHESLIRQWNTLSGWVDEEGEYAAVYLRLIESARLHRDGKKDFLDGSELQNALRWRDEFKPISEWANRYKKGFEESITYLNESEMLFKNRVKDQIAKEREELEKQREDERKQLEVEANKKKQKYLIGGVSILLVLSIGAILFAMEANKQRNRVVEAEKREERLAADRDKLIRLNETDSTQEILNDSIIDFGVSQEKIRSYTQSDYSKIAEINHKIEQLISRIDTNITIFYFPKLTDEDKALLSLVDIHFKLELKPTKEYMLNQETTSIWVSSNLNEKIENVKIVALYLMRAGIKIRSIRIAPHLNRGTAGIISIVSDSKVLNDEEWGIEDVMGMKVVGRNGGVRE